MLNLCVVYLTYIFFVFFLLPTLILGEEQALGFSGRIFCILYSYSPANSLFLLEASQSMNFILVFVA